MASLRRTKSQGHLLEKYITGDLNKYIDEKSANRIEKVLGKKYAGSVRLYKFPVEKCKEIKAYKVLEENKSEETKRLLEEMKVEKKESRFEHLINRLGELPKKDIDFNALAIISHGLAEKFERDSGDFEVGPLKDTRLVEFHTYSTTQSTNQLGFLRKHTDDDGAVDYKTITMIWYLIKDKDVEGGNIIFYAPPPPPVRAHYLSQGVMPKDYEIKINLWEQMGDVRENCVCLIFKGDVDHSPEEMSGTGERSAIVFQFVRIDKPIESESTEGGNKKAMKIKNKKNIKTLKRCSRRAYRAGECYNFQALGCDVPNKPRTALFFKSVKEREAYVKSKTGKRKLMKCDRISRYSVVSATKGGKPVKSRDLSKTHSNKRRGT